MENLTKLNNLTFKESRFVEELVNNGFCAGRACQAVYCVTSYGSARAYASELLKKEHIQKALAEFLDKEGIGIKFVIRELKKEVEREANSPSERAVRLKAIELIGKHVGAFKENVELSSRELSRIEIVMDGEDDTPCQGQS